MSRNGLVKMQDVYKMNPKLGNASTLNKDLDESAVSLDLLRKDLTKYEVKFSRTTILHLVDIFIGLFLVCFKEWSFTTDLLKDRPFIYTVKYECTVVCSHSWRELNEY